MSADLLDRPEVSPPGLDEDDTVAHLADRAKVTEGYIMGTPVEALCGFMFVPTKDPLGLPVCPKCKEVCEAFGFRTPES